MAAALEPAAVVAGLPEPAVSVAREYARCRARGTREAFRCLLHTTAHRAPRLLRVPSPDGCDYVAGLRHLAREHRNWVRYPDDVPSWRPAAREPRRAFASLARYLLARYPVPEFLAGVFLQREPGVCPAWYAHLAQGGSLPGAPGLRVPLTRRMAHHFTQAPGGYSVLRALRWAQARGVGLSRGVAAAYCSGFPGERIGSPRQESWLLSFLRWLAAYPELPPHCVGELLRYLQWYPVPEGGLLLRGRTPRSLAALLGECFTSAADLLAPRGGALPSSGLRGGTWRVGEGALGVTWTVAEVRSRRALAQEGRAMDHCVATYAPRVAAGKISIWSVRRWEGPRARRALTVEVHNAARRVRQVRGRANRWPSRHERRALELWAAEAGLVLDYTGQDRPA